MKFNWLTTGDLNPATKRVCIELEYRLRPKITKFLLARIDGEDCGDLSCFHFDVDLDNKWVWIGKKTPKEYIEKVKDDFDNEINGSPLFSVA